MRKKKKSVTAIDHASSFLNSWECPKLIFTGLDKAGEIDTKKNIRAATENKKQPEERWFPAISALEGDA